MKETQIIDTAKLNFEELTHWHLNIKNFKQSAKDIDIDLIIELSDEKNKNKKVMMVECKNEVRRNDLAKFLEQKRKYINLFIIAQYISKPDREFLREQGINYLESSGNCFIKDTNTYIFIDHLKTQHLRVKNTAGIFTNNTMRLAYTLLLEPNLLNEPFRSISKKAEISLGSVGNALETLVEAGLLKVKNNEKTISDPIQLFETWANNYANTMRPHLFKQRLSFTDKTMLKDWKNILTKNDFWGGEPAANILDLYLSPEIFTIYSTRTLSEIMKAYKLMPDIKGNVLYMFPPFKERSSPGKMADPFLIYAELILSKDSRCLEAAKRIRDKYIEPTLRHI